MGSHPMTPARIGLADDDAPLREMLTRMLKAIGHQVVCAVSNGQEFLEACAREKPCLAILDLDMPVTDGLATAEALRALGVPSILLSGHPDLAHVVLAREPVATTLRKPVSIDQLSEAIEKTRGQLDPAADC